MERRRARCGQDRTLPGGDAVNTFHYADNGAQNAYIDPESEDTRTDTDTASASAYWRRAKAVKYWNAAATEVVGETTYDVSAAGRVKSVESKIDQGVSRTTTYAWDGGGRTTRTATNGRASLSKFDVAV